VTVVHASVRQCTQQSRHPRSGTVGTSPTAADNPVWRGAPTTSVVSRRKGISPWAGDVFAISVGRRESA
jgi:hypothetical protein